jgi:hypothetical protein
MDDQGATVVPKFAQLVGLLVFGALLYVISSGPVLAVAFWLREATGWDGFYLSMWIYYPLLVSGDDTWAKAYIEWWVRLLGTVGPG